MIMEREIKFRGYNEGWHYGCYLRDARANINGTQFLTLSDAKIVDFIVYSNDKGFNIVEVIPESVGQYTELKDDTGKEIYERDIMDVTSDWGCVGEVVYRQGEYRVRLDKKQGSGFDSLSSLLSNSKTVIIGNKFQNPELLK